MPGTLSTRAGRREGRQAFVLMGNALFKGKVDS